MPTTALLQSDIEQGTPSVVVPAAVDLARADERILDGHTTAAWKRKHGGSGEHGPHLSKPLMPAQPNETLTTYFARLQLLHATAILSISTARPMEDGLYLHKRPAVGGGEAHSLLALAGTVLHHVVLYEKCGSKIHCIDFGPADGSDVSRDLMTPCPCRPCIRPDTTIPPEDTLPLMYLGKPTHSWDSAEVAQATSFAESRPYSALRNNCIHFADFIVRVMTDGRVRGAPLLYDLMAKGVPAADVPLLVMLPLFMGITWFQIVDGSGMTAEYLKWREGSGGDDSDDSDHLPLKRQEVQQGGGPVPEVLASEAQVQEAAVDAAAVDVAAGAAGVGEGGDAAAV